MRKLAVIILLFVGLGVTQLPAQGVVTKTEAKKAEPAETPQPEKNKVIGVNESLRPREPITTEIYADEAFFDSTKYVGTFTGHVKVNDPRFNLQSDKMTVYMSKDKNQGLEKAVAEGNVAVVRERPDPNGGPPTRAVGRSETAIYLPATGDVELRGTPRVQRDVNMHVATSPDTVMIITQNGQLTTHGPSRTEIRQEPSPSPSPSPAEGEKKTEASPRP